MYLDEQCFLFKEEDEDEDEHVHIVYGFIYFKSNNIYKIKLLIKLIFSCFFNRKMNKRIICAHFNR